MTAPDTSHNPHEDPAQESPADTPAQAPAPQAGAAQAPPPEYPPVPAPAGKPQRSVRTEALIAVLLLAGSALLGVLAGFLWHWLAPKVPLYADSSAVYLKDPEGEQAIGADGTFAIIGGCAGLLAGAVAYWLSRRRQGGVTVALGLVAGGLLGGYIAMKLGTALGPGGNVIATAKSVPTGSTFYGPLKLTAKGVLLTWPAAAMVVLIGLTALFTPKPQAPPVVWQTPAQDRPDTP
ncbi:MULTISPECIES: hypothetical protein [Streptacidiphilus]|uniref:ABC transporter permease n=2 Tax=Streptacidiphilus TaxID=228398 RepID=A0ABV6UQW6_9ACTN|nr:hypothetical protein [Streptacidiphilus jeojiense]